MRIDFVTLFPEMFSPIINGSILGRALNRGVFEAGYVNPRDFSSDKHHRVDDRPFGGGPGMVLMAEPLRLAISSIKQKNSHVVFLSPQGRRFDAACAQRLSQETHLVFVCGHYEGIDARAESLFDEEISIGDYVLTGGELPAMVVADAVVRLIPGVLKKADAVVAESFVDGTLDFPQYTKPRAWRGRKVPDVLLSGDHIKIAAWRRKAALAATKKKRPDLLLERA